MSLRGVILAALATAFLSGCVSKTELLEVWTDPPVEETRTLYGDSTRLGYTLSHGTQVSYSSRDGKIYLWYPSNKLVLEGRWWVREGKPSRVEGPSGPMQVANNFICFEYGANTYNPATGARGGNAQCMRSKAFGKYHVNEVRSGDVFGLAKRREVPFVLSTSPVSIDNLLSQLPSGS